MLKTKLRVLIPLLLCTFVLFAASLACIETGNGSSADNNSLQQTKISLGLTQTVIANIQLNPPQDQPATEAPQVTEEIIAEVVPDVSYEGISFSFDSSIAASVSPSTVPGQNLGENYMPGDTYPTHYEFLFNGYALAGAYHTAIIRVYPVAEYESISQLAVDSFAEFRAALDTHPSAGPDKYLPFIPFWPAAQILTAQSAYFDFQNGSGLRYMVMYGQELYPVDNKNLFYTYQGMTTDGAYYVSAILPISHRVLPNDADDVIGDWETFMNNWDTYLFETVQLLGEQTPQSYYPQMNLLDAMMQSFSINP
ncbi:MAG: hypothetical protein ABIG43_05260 [Chloroflexota bacterium]